MKRIAIKLVVFLLLGAVVNVGVAWGCAIYIDLWALEHERSSGYHDAGSHTWRVVRHERRGATRANCRCDRRRVDGHELRSRQRALPWGVVLTDWIASPTTGMYACVDLRGWPERSLWCGFLVEGKGPTRSLKTHGGLELEPFARRANAWPSGDVLGPARALPLRPAFPGFIINTAFYGAILWMLWSTPCAARRLIRKRRGRCLKCGYDLRHAEHEVCPECGA